MNYRHIFHAGNFADVMKHIILIINLKQLLKKEKSFTVLDCFAGSGQYDLTSIDALKTSESSVGINKILTYFERENLKLAPIALQEYIQLVRLSGNIKHYPGSPLIIYNYLRLIDQLIAVELHSKEFTNLSNLFYSDKSVKVHNLDAYLAIKAFVPFTSRRGLIFIDPPFEVLNEFDKIINILNIIKKRIISTCIIIWYPIKYPNKVKMFYNQIKQLGFTEIIKLEFTINNNLIAPNNKNSMNSMGMLIINPPNILDEIEDNLKIIKHNIYSDMANYIINFL